MPGLSASSLTTSLLWCHLKTTNESAKFETLTCFCLIFRSVMRKDFSSKHSTESRCSCYRSGKYTVCRRVRASFSPEMLQAGDVKGLRRPLKQTIKNAICKLSEQIYFCGNVQVFMYVFFNASFALHSLRETDRLCSIYILRMYLWSSLCTLNLHACQVRVTVGDSSLCCCTCVTYFERN